MYSTYTAACMPYRDHALPAAGAAAQQERWLLTVHCYFAAAPHGTTAVAARRRRERAGCEWSWVAETPHAGCLDIPLLRDQLCGPRAPASRAAAPGLCRSNDRASAALRLTAATTHRRRRPCEHLHRCRRDEGYLRLVDDHPGHGNVVVLLGLHLLAGHRRAAGAIIRR